MKIHVNDYCVVVSNSNKKHLVQVTNVSEARMEGIVDNRDKGSDAARVTMDFERRDVIANLGANPFAFGQVFGVSIEPFVKTKQIRPFSGVHVFRDMLEAEEKAVLDSLKKCGRIAHQRGLFPNKAVLVEIRPPKGKYAGMYRHSKKEDVEDQLILRPKLVEDTDYIVYHEIGHGVDHCLVTPELHAEWLHAFIKSSVLREVTKQHLHDWLRELKESGNCAALLSRSEDDDKIAVQEIFKYVASRHKVGKEDIDVLLASEQFDELELLWPTKPILLGKKNVLVTEYATSNVRELFAECFAYFMLDRDMPIALKKLMRKTIKAIAP